MTTTILHLFENCKIPCMPTLDYELLLKMYSNNEYSIEREQVTCKNCLQLTLVKQCKHCEQTLSYKEFYTYDRWWFYVGMIRTRIDLCYPCWEKWGKLCPDCKDLRIEDLKHEIKNSTKQCKKCSEKL